MVGGCEAEMGLLPRTVKMLFQRMKYLETLGWRLSLKVCFSEIYNEKMVDLLDEKGSEIQDMVLSRMP